MNTSSTWRPQPWTKWQQIWYDIDRAIERPDEEEHTYGILKVSDSGPPVLVHVQDILVRLTETIATMSVLQQDEQRFQGDGTEPKRLYLELASHDLKMLGFCRIEHVAEEYAEANETRRTHLVRLHDFVHYRSSREAITAHAILAALIGDESRTHNADKDNT